MDFIKGFCRTNLDNYDCTEVKEFVAVPRIGEKVRVIYKGNTTTLKVCGVTHSLCSGIPRIVVELNN